MLYFLPANLRLLRKNRKMTQTQIARHLGIERSTYSYYENGKRCPPLTLLIELCALFKTNLDSLVSEDMSSRAEHVLPDGRDDRA